MPRHKVALLSPPADGQGHDASSAPTPSPRVIPAEAVFQLGELQAILGLPRHTLRREARLGRLRTAKRAGRLWTTGQWFHEWLRGGEVRRRAPGGNSQPNPTQQGVSRDPE
jgi:hypothetical protein